MKGITVKKYTHNLEQGDEFILAGKNYVITQRPDVSKDDVVIHFALINPNVLCFGSLTLPFYMPFEIVK